MQNSSPAQRQQPEQEIQVSTCAKVNKSWVDKKYCCRSARQKARVDGTGTIWSQLLWTGVASELLVPTAGAKVGAEWKLVVLVQALVPQWGMNG